MWEFHLRSSWSVIPRTLVVLTTFNSFTPILTLGSKSYFRLKLNNIRVLLLKLTFCFLSSMKERKSDISCWRKFTSVSNLWPVLSWKLRGKGASSLVVRSSLRLTALALELSSTNLARKVLLMQWTQLLFLEDLEQKLQRDDPGYSRPEESTVKGNYEQKNSKERPLWRRGRKEESWRFCTSEF